MTLDYGTGEKEVWPGDIVQDKDHPDRKMVVEKVTERLASDYTFETSGGHTMTVAEANEEYPEDDLVVTVRFINKKERSLGTSRYAYPVSRLRVKHSELS